MITEGIKMKPWEKNPHMHLTKFLASHKVPEDAPKGSHTHTCYGPPWGSYKIPDEELSTFYNIYKKVIGQGIELHITEKQKDCGPFLLDLDFNFSLKNKERQYTSEDVELVVGKVADVFCKYHKVARDEFEVIVMEKNEPTYKEDKKLYKDGFHVILPAPIKAEVRCAMTEDLKNQADEEKWFSNIPHTNSLDDVFDKSVAFRNGWMMYGSRKHDGKMYEITHLFDGHIKRIRLDRYCSDERPWLCSVRQYESDDTLEIRDDFMEKDEQERIEQIADIYMPSRKINKKKKLSPTTAVKMFDEISENNGPLVNRPYDENHVELAKKLIKILSPKRADTYSDWIQVGWTLYNISDTLLKEFDEFSKTYPKKYQKGACAEYWRHMEYRDDGLGIATLKWWATLDNKSECKKILSIHANKRILEKEFGRHDDIALAMREMYGHIYKCVSIKKDTWFEYQGHRWVKIESGYTLSNRMSDEVAVEYGTVIMDHLSSLDRGDPKTAEQMMEKMKMVGSLIKNLKTQSFKNAVMDACRHRFYDPEFEKKINQHTHLLGFNNGVYDLKNRCFRSGAPDDYLTFSTGYDYSPNFSIDDPEVEEVYNFFKTVQPEEDMCEYILTLLASYLDGEAEDQNFIIWTGAGCHKKDTDIMMHDGSVKKVQEIKHGDKLMGDNGRSRLVKRLFQGEQEMYKITLTDGTKYSVNKEHRLALISTFEPKIELSEEYPDTWKVTWHENIEHIPIERYYYADTENQAFDFLKEIRETEHCILSGMSVPITISDYFLIKENVKKYYKTYRVALPDKNGINDKLLRCIKDNLIEETEDVYRVGLGFEDTFNARYLGHAVYEQSDRYVISKAKYNFIPYDFSIELDTDTDKMYYGFEIDGNHKYLLGNMIVSYNSNGKSTITELAQYTYGDYFGTVPITLLTQKRGSSSSANPELADKAGKRFLTMNETEHDDVIHVGYMKELTGGDLIQARALYAEPFTYKPQFHLLVLCNNLPSIPSNDGGTWRRIRAVLFPIAFVKNPVKPNERKGDKSLKGRIKKWNKAFMWLLLNKYYPLYKDQGITEPRSVIEHTDKYKKDVDIYYEFMSENLVQTGNQKDSESFAAIFSTFKSWYKEYYDHHNPPKKNLTGYFESLDIKMTRSGKVLGVRFAGADDNDTYNDL